MRLPIVFTALLALIFSGSSNAGEDQGVSDYAKAHWRKGESCTPFVRKYESVCGSNFSTDAQNVESKDLDNRGKYNSCSDIAPEQGPEVQKGQIISVYLQQAYIDEFKERGEGNFFRKKRGEIAVVARVAELESGTDFDFTVAGRDRGRLVYYSEGVQEGQFLNFSQLPIYGPIEYTGKPLLLEFYIIELDVKENTEVSGLLAAAAGLGAIAYPPASPILKVLDTIGGGLLKANQSDLEFKYHATLLAGDMQIAALRNGRLEYGNYVFVRMPYTNPKDKGSTSVHPWSEWWFNQKNGRLYGDRNCSSLVSQNYLSVQINRAKEATTLDASNTFQNFLGKLTSEAQSSAKVKIDIIDGLKDTVQEDKQYRDARKLIDEAAGSRWPTGVTSDQHPIGPAAVAALKNLSIEVESSLKGLSKKFTEAHSVHLVEAFNRLLNSPPKYSQFTFNSAEVSTALDSLR
jgi:hypothetical protein